MRATHAAHAITPQSFNTPCLKSQTIKTGSLRTANIAGQDLTKMLYVAIRPVEHPPMLDQTGSERCTHAKRAFNDQSEIVALACDQWNCDYCSKILAWRWAQRVRYGIALRLDHEPWFWTITLPGWVPDAKTGYKILPARWQSLRHTLQRQNRDFLYAAFVEAHPNRAFIPHLHIITFDPSPDRLKDMVVHAGFGHQAKELEITSRIAVNYVTKYVSKQGVEMPRNFRRVRISHSWPRLPPPLYEHTVYPVESREALTAYLRRMSTTLGTSVALLRDRWLDKSGDIA